MLITNFGSVSSQGGLMLPDWNYGNKITIPANSIDADLTNFPCQVILNSSNFDFTKAKADGSDIRFTDKNLNFLKHERVEHAGTARFDGNGDYFNVSCPTAFGNESFTVEIKNLVFSTLVSSPNVVSLVSGNTTGDFFLSYYNSGGTYYLGVARANVAYDATVAYPFIANTSYDITVTKSNNTIYLFVNGVLVYSVANTQTYNISNILNIVSWNTGLYLDGSIGGVRVTDNIARYTANYTPPSIFTVDSSNVVFCTNFNKTLSNGTFSDDTGKTVTAYGNANISIFAKYNVLLPTVSDLTDTEFYVWFGNPNAYNTSIEAWQDQTGKQLIYNGNVKLAPNVAKFGKCAYFDGTGDYLTVPSGDGTSYFSGDFTVETYLNCIASTEYICGSFGGATWTSRNYALYHNATTIFFDYGVGSGYTSLSVAYALKVGTLYHIAVVRYGSTIYLYLDGTMIGSTTAGVMNTNNTPLYIGCGGSNYTSTSTMNGYLDEFRISNIARHTSNFTPPTEPYTVDAYTKLLMHFDATPSKDETGKTVTTYGDVKPIKTAYADGARSAYWTAGGHLTATGIKEVSTGSSNFCIENKVVFPTLPALNNGNYIYTKYLASPLTVFYIALVNDGGVYKLYVYVYNAGISVIVNWTPQLFKEYDITFEKNGNVYTLYVDGIAVGSTTNAADISYLNTLQTSYFGYYPAGYYTAGYLLGSRITKDTARYGGNYTPPAKYEVDSANVQFCSMFDTIYDQNYAMVQHMGDSLVDATGNGNNGTATGTTVVSTTLGKVRQFDGTDDKIVTPLFTNTDNVTLTVMATKIGTGGTDLLFYVGTSGTNGYGLYTNSLKFSLKATSTFADTTVSNTTTPQVVTLTRTNGTWSAMIDGISYAVTNLAVTTPTGSTYFGGSTTDYYDGQLSNARYVTVARNQAYTKAEQKALKNTLLTISNA